MKVTISKRKAAAGAVCACALVACLGVASAAFAAGSSAAVADVDENVPASVSTTTGDYIKGAATRAAGPALEILGLASVEESGQFVNTTDWYDWSYPKYYLCATSYCTELSPFLANLANGEEPAAVVNSSRAGGGSGPNASLQAYGGDDESDQAVWALEPDVVVGTGGGVDYPDGVEGVEYSFSNYTELVATMNEIATASDWAAAKDNTYDEDGELLDSGRELRFGSAADIAQAYEEYIFGTIGAVAEAIATEDNEIDKRTIALVESATYDDAAQTWIYGLLSDEAASGGDGTAATNRYLETTSANGLDTVLDLADNYADTTVSVTADVLKSSDIDLILVGGQSSSGSYGTISAALEDEGLLYKTYLVDSSSNVGAMYGVVMNSVENAQNVGRILGCLYPEVVSQQDWLAYYYETFYHIDADELATVMDSALDGVRCWGNGTTTAGTKYTYDQVTTWDAENCGYTSGSDASTVAASISDGYAYYQEAIAGAETTAAAADTAAETDETATAQLATASTASVLSTASLSTQDSGIWTVKDSDGTETSYDSFSSITLASGDTVTLNDDATDDISVSLSDSSTDSYTIDLAGHTLTGQVSASLNGTLNITSTADSQATISYGIDLSAGGTGSATHIPVLKASSGTVNVSNVKIDSHSLPVSSSYCGMGVYAAGASVVMENVDVVVTPYDSDTGFTSKQKPVAIYVDSGTVDIQDSTTSVQASACAAQYVLNVYHVGGTLSAENCDFTTEISGDSLSYSAAMNYMRPIYITGGDASFTNCNMQAYCESTASSNQKTVYGLCKTGDTASLSLDSCNITSYGSGTVYGMSLTNGSISIAGEFYVDGSLSLSTSGKADIEFLPGLTLLAPFDAAKATTSYKVASFGTSTDDSGNTVTWTADEAEAITSMVICSSSTYCTAVTYDETDATLPSELWWNTSDTATATTTTAGDAVTACPGEDYTLSATVALSDGTALSDAAVSWVYFADEDCLQRLDGAPDEPGTYYCKAVYAGNSTSFYTASVSDAVTLTIREHELEKTEAVEASCTADGNAEYWTCSLCGQLFSDEDATTATTAEDVVIAATGHTAGDAVTENEVAASCTEGGSYDTVVYCSVCGTELSRETTAVAATGHSYVAVVTAPTSTEQGYTTYTCSVCGDTYVGDYTDATGSSASSKATKAKQTLKVTKKAKTVKRAKVKKKAVKVKAITKVTGAKGKLSYKLVSAKKGSKSFKAKFKVNAKTGKITVKKGTKKGTYKVKVKVKAAATAKYKAATKTVTVTIKVK